MLLDMHGNPMIVPGKKTVPPLWRADALSSFLDVAENNVWATFHNKKETYNTLSKLDDCFRLMAGHLSFPRDGSRFLAALFVLRSYSAFLASCRLSMGGQCAESCATLRICLEYALYAIHVFKNTCLSELWLRRHENEEILRKVKKKFRHRDVIQTLQGVSAPLYDETSFLYQTCIDYGARPNERAVTGSGKTVKDSGNVSFSQLFLHSDGQFLNLHLQLTCRVGIASLSICKIVFQERFDLLGIDDHLKAISAELRQNSKA